MLAHSAVANANKQPLMLIMCWN